MTMIKGIAASNGIAIAKAYKLVMPDLTVTKETVEDVEKEIKAYEEAMECTSKQLEAIKEAASKNLSAEEAAVFDAHALVLSDPELKTQVEDKIKNEKCNAAAALEEVANTFVTMFESMGDEYFRERAADIKDVSRRLLANLLGKSLPNPALIDEEVVIIADDLTPSDTAQLNKNLVRGFATNIGGRTSHSAIMARSLEIPAVVACKTITDEVKEDAKEAIAKLKQLGIKKTVMLTGDRKSVAEQVANELGIDEVHSDLLPADKVEQMERLFAEKSKKGKLVFVGDGINDAPVLARADIGIAMGALGSDAAIEAADIVIMNDKPSRIATVMGISRKTLNIVIQNISLAFIVKFAALVLGAFGMATLWEAVFADVGVAVLAILNAIRALRYKEK